MQAVVSCLCADPRSAWELTGHQGEREAALPRLHPASQLDPVYIYRFTKKAVDKHKYTSLLDFC